MPLVVVAYERPAQVASPVRDKAALEYLHLHRFREDARSLGGGDPFEAVRQHDPGDDPPDFSVTLRGAQSELGLECTQWADQGRRHASALFETVRETMRQRGPTPFRHLAGMTVHVAFLEETRTTAPANRDRKLRDEVLDAIAQLRPDSASYMVPAGKPPPKFEGPQQWVTTPSGAMVAAVPVLPGHKASDFMLLYGYEPALVFNGTYRLDAVVDQLERVVAEKDVPGNDLLLITAAGPDIHGRAHVSEEAVTSLVLEAGIALEPRHHLSRVVLHRCFSHEAWEVYPVLRKLFGPTQAPLLDDATADRRST
jgi:hypothetical protein